MDVISDNLEKIWKQTGPPRDGDISWAEQCILPLLSVVISMKKWAIEKLHKYRGDEFGRGSKLAFVSLIFAAIDLLSNLYLLVRFALSDKPILAGVAFGFIMLPGLMLLYYSFESHKSQAHGPLFNESAQADKIWIFFCPLFPPWYLWRRYKKITNQAENVDLGAERRKTKAAACIWLVAKAFFSTIPQIYLNLYSQVMANSYATTEREIDVFKFITTHGLEVVRMIFSLGTLTWGVVSLRAAVLGPDYYKHYPNFDFEFRFAWQWLRIGSHAMLIATVWWCNPKSSTALIVFLLSYQTLMLRFRPPLNKVTNIGEKNFLFAYIEYNIVSVVCNVVGICIIRYNGLRFTAYVVAAMIGLSFFLQFVYCCLNWGKLAKVMVAKPEPRDCVQSPPIVRISGKTTTL